MSGKEGGSRFAPETGWSQRADARHAVVGGTDPKRRLPALAQPVRKPHMVRVHVGHDHPQDRQAVKFLVKNLFPLGAGGVIADAAIHHAPSLHTVQFVAQQPQVDVVEGERQRHADPFDAGCYKHRGARRRQGIAKRVVQLFFQFVQWCS